MASLLIGNGYVSSKICTASSVCLNTSTTCDDRMVAWISGMEVHLSQSQAFLDKQYRNENNDGMLRALLHSVQATSGPRCIRRTASLSPSFPYLLDERPPQPFFRSISMR